jgi:hypothetical protein
LVPDTFAQNVIFRDYRDYTGSNSVPAFFSKSGKGEWVNEWIIKNEGLIKYMYIYGYIIKFDLRTTPLYPMTLD